MRWIARDRPNPPFGKVIVPGIEVPEIVLENPRLTEYGRWLLNDYVPIAGGANNMGDAVELKVLDHLVANATYAAPSPYLGLWTSAVDDTSTAATSGELTYT